MANNSTLNKTLAKFSKDLAPSDEFMAAGKRIADRIFRLLQPSKFYSVARSKISGSIGKHTALNLDPDLDLVVFVNGEHPEFTKVLSNFQDILLSADMDVKEIKVTKHSIGFTVDDFSFDLLPATNFVENTSLGGADLAKLQANRTLEYIKRDTANGYKYGSSVSEQTLEFLKAQTSYVHEIVRLAKFWNKTLHFGDTYISGRSTLIELIAIQAAREQEATGDRSYLQGFKKFLKLVANFQNLNVKFCGFYQEHDIPYYVKAMRPLVLDPVNPYNNFARFPTREKAGIIAKFEKFAKESLIRLERSEDFCTIFEVQPKVIIPGFQTDINWLVGTSEKSLINPKMEVRISDKAFNGKVLEVSGIRKCLLTTIAAGTLPASNADLNRVKKAVQNCIDLNICGQLVPRNWGPGTTETHAKYDITFSIPIPGVPNKCVEVSTDFK